MYTRFFVLIGLVFLLFSFTLLSSEAFFFKKKKEQAGGAVENIEKDRKVLVVEIFAGWCPACKNIQPTLDLLQAEVKDITFVKLDVSTPSKANESAKLAKKWGIDDFYKLNKSKTSTVGVFNPWTKKLVAAFQNNNDIDEYKEAIKEAQKQESAEEPK